MLRLYTDESPGLKVDPVVVLVLSLVFIFSVVALHSEFPSFGFLGWGLGKGGGGGVKGANGLQLLRRLRGSFRARCWVCRLAGYMRLRGCILGRNCGRS